MGGGAMGSIGGGAGVVMRAEGFGLEGCDLLLLKHLTDNLMHLDRYLLSGQELDDERLLDHSEDFDLLRLMRLSSVYNVVTSPNSMKIEDGKSPHVHRALPTATGTLDVPRSKDDCDRETDLVHLRIDSEKDVRDDKDTNGRGFFFVSLLVVVVVVRVLHFVVNLFCDKMAREGEGRSGGVEMKVKAVSDDLTRAFGCVDFIEMSRNKNRAKKKKRSGPRARGFLASSSSSLLFLVFSVSLSCAAASIGEQIVKEDPDSVSVQLQLQSDSFPFQERLLESCIERSEKCNVDNGVQQCCKGLYCEKNPIASDKCKDADVCTNDSNDSDNIVQYFEYYDGCVPKSETFYRDRCHEGVYTPFVKRVQSSPDKKLPFCGNRDASLDGRYYTSYSAYDGENRRESCQCQDVQSQNGKPMYYVEQITSDDSSKRGSLCVQCRGGTFFGKRVGPGGHEFCRCDNVSSRTCLNGYEGTCYSWKCEKQMNHCWYYQYQIDARGYYFPDVQEVPTDDTRGCHVCVKTAEGSFDFDYVCSDTNYNGLAMVPSSPEPGEPGRDDWSEMCQPCPKGTYSEQGDEYCRACEPGYYTDEEESTSCKICPEGTISNSPGGATACKPCGTGSFVGAGEGKVTCICKEGYYNDNDGFGIPIDSCIACPEGTFKEYPGSESCESCLPGSYNKNPGSQTCTLADVGYFVQSYGSVEQSICPEGFYSDVVGSPQCIPCPEGKSTIGVGSTSQSDCIVCPYGVNELFACRNETETLFLTKDICWNPTHILELDSSNFIVADFASLVLSLSDYGVLDVIGTTMEGIQLDADSDLSTEKYFEYVQNIEFAYGRWLLALDENIPSCVDDLSRSDSNSAATAEPVATAIGGSVSGDYSFSFVDGMNFWSISGTGSANTDELHFLHSAETRERGIIVTTTIDSFEVEAATANDFFALGGLLIRETLEQKPDSKFLSIFVDSDDGLAVQLRGQLYCLLITTGQGAFDGGTLEVSVDSGRGYVKVTPSEVSVFSSNEIVVNECFASIRGVQVSNPTTDGWAGFIEVSSDNKETYSSMICSNGCACDTCTSNCNCDASCNNGERRCSDSWKTMVVVDGNNDGNAPIKCFDGRKCTFDIPMVPTPSVTVASCTNCVEFPLSLKIEKVGNKFSSSYKTTNQTNWTYLATDVELDFGSFTSYYSGIAVSSDVAMAKLKGSDYRMYSEADEWYYYMRCSGATFACATNASDYCNAVMCFDGAYGIFSSYLGLNGVTFNQKNSDIVPVPGKSIAWLAEELQTTVATLVNKNNLNTIKARLAESSVQLKELKAQIQNAETTIIDAVAGTYLQIEATKAVTELDSYLTQAQLQYTILITNFFGLARIIGELAGDDSSFFYEYQPPDSPTLSPTSSLHPTITSTNPEKSFCNIYTQSGPNPMEGSLPWDSDTDESCSCSPTDICVNYGEDEQIQSKAQIPYQGLQRADRNCCYIKRYKDQNAVVITKYCCPISSVMFFCDQNLKIKKAMNIIIQVVVMVVFMVLGPMIAVALSGAAAAGTSATAGRAAANQGSKLTPKGRTTIKTGCNRRRLTDHKRFLQSGACTPRFGNSGRLANRPGVWQKFKEWFKGFFRQTPVQQRPPSPKNYKGTFADGVKKEFRQQFVGATTKNPLPPKPSEVVAAASKKQDGHFQGLFHYRRLTASGANVMQLFDDVPEDISPDDPRLLSDHVDMDTDREDTIEIDVDEQSLPYGYRFEFFSDLIGLQIQWSLLFQEAFKGDDIAMFNPITELPPLTESILDASNELDLSALAAYYSFLASITGYVLATSDLTWKKLHTQFSLDAVQVLANPPGCKPWASQITQYYKDSLAMLALIGDTGDAMETSLLTYFTSLQRISEALETLAAVKKANSALTVEVEPDNAIPSRFQGNYDASIHKLINLYSTESFLSEIYSVDSTLSGYCNGYSYTHADQVADPCIYFGGRYLPSPAVLDELMSDLDEATEQDKLHHALMKFAEEVAADPTFYGYNRDASGSTRKTISLEFKPSVVQYIDGTLIDVDTDTSQMLDDGRVAFQLTASSDILKKSKTPFSIDNANPAVTNVRAFWKGVYVEDGNPIQLLETRIQSKGPYAIYDTEGKKHKFSLPEFIDKTTGVDYFSKTNSIQTKLENPCTTADSCANCLCGTDRKSRRLEWADGSSTCICTDETEGNALDGLPGVFTFPSLWSQWVVQADSNDWSNPYSIFAMNYTQLTLQVVFEIMSTADLIGSPMKCHSKCDQLHTAMTDQFGWNKHSVLIGQDWCEEDAMSSTISNDCVNLLPIQGDDDTPINGGFCRCNMGTDTAVMSSADLTTIYSFTQSFDIEVTTSASGGRRRRQLRGNKRKRKKKAMAMATAQSATAEAAAVAATKSGKGGTTNNGSKSGKSNSQIGVGTYDQNGSEGNNHRRGLLGNQTHQNKVYGDIVMKTVEKGDESEGYILTVTYDLQFPTLANGEGRDAYKFYVKIKDTSGCPGNLDDLDSVDDLSVFTGNNEEVWEQVIDGIDDNGRASGIISVSYIHSIEILFDKAIVLVNRNDGSYMHCTVFREIEYADPQTTTEEIKLDVFNHLDFAACANETLSVLHTFLKCEIDEVEDYTKCTVSFSIEQHDDGEKNSTSIVSPQDFDRCIKDIMNYPGFTRHLAELMGGCDVHVFDGDGNQFTMAWEHCTDSNDVDELFE